MRRLTAREKAKASECLGLAFSHLRIAQTLIKSKEYAYAISDLYYAAFFAAKSACVERGTTSKKHQYWVGIFNKSFGRGLGWVPKTYPKMLTKLLEDREAIDYEGALENDEEMAKSYVRRVESLLKLVRSHTPLLLYPEFIQEILNNNPTVLAVEFDYYCPKAYIHKERIQFQIKADSYSSQYLKKLIKAGSASASLLRAARKEDYVLGWNNRLGQGGDGYLLFLDVDENDEGKVKAALKDRKGWLFKSGGGFHFIGLEVLSSKELWLHRFTKVARSKKLKKLVDKKHLDFSIRRGYSTLRVTSSEVKNFVPFMCWDNT